MAVKEYSALLIEGDPAAIDLARAANAESCPELDLTVLEGVDPALAWLKSSAPSHRQVPDIILIDLGLPKLDGLALVRTIRNYPAMRSIPLVVFSAEHTPAEVLISYRAGANSFVAKPIDQAQFCELFREQIEYWMRQRRRDMAAASMGDAAGRI